MFHQLNNSNRVCTGNNFHAYAMQLSILLFYMSCCTICLLSMRTVDCCHFFLLILFNTWKAAYIKIYTSVCVSMRKSNVVQDLRLFVHFLVGFVNLSLILCWFYVNVYNLFVDGICLLHYFRAAFFLSVHFVYFGFELIC